MQLWRAAQRRNHWQWKPAASSGEHIMVGAIEAGNASFIRPHEKLGFEHVGLMRVPRSISAVTRME